MAFLKGSNSKKYNRDIDLLNLIATVSIIGIPILLIGKALKKKK